MSKAEVGTVDAALRACPEAPETPEPTPELANRLFDAFDAMVTTLKAAPREGASAHTLMMPRESVSQAVYAFRDAMKAALLPAPQRPEALPPIKVPDVPAPTAELCWKQNARMVRCDRKAGHGGRHSWERAEPLDPSLADTQINARIEQILQKFLRAEALTVGDTVFLFDLVRTLRRAEALAPPAPPAQAWQPMETAPRDGTHIVLFGTLWNDPDQRPRACVSWWCTSRADSPAHALGWFFSAPGYTNGFNPTAWMPKPSAVPSPPRADAREAPRPPTRYTIDSLGKYADSNGEWVKFKEVAPFLRAAALDAAPASTTAPTPEKP